jgi:predicted PurR-regulated permease PerM
MRGASTAFNVGAGALLLLVFAFFFLKDGRDIRDGIVRFVPGDAHWQRWKPAAAEIWMTLGRYVRGVTIVAAFDAILMGLALWAIGVPMIWAIMAITFVGAFIPLAGPVIATVVAVIAALGDGGMTDALLVIGAGITVQLIEGNVLQPYVMGRSVRVHPVVVLAAVAVGAIVWGIPGALLAVPAAATAIIILHHVTGTTADSESAATDGA